MAKELIAEALLREIVEISGESIADRILRKTSAAAKRLIIGIEVTFIEDSNRKITYQSAKPLNSEQEEVAELLAKTATFARANSQSTDLAHRLELNEERLRIARDLHDRVLQRIFATGISLEGALRKAVVDDVIKALRQAIVDLDETVGQIRTTVHSLKGPVGSIRQQILHEIESARKAWDLALDFNLRGPIDSVIPKETYEDIVAVSAELLNNAGKHSDSRHAKYDLTVTGNSLEISVSNQINQSKTIKFGSGLENLSDRASKYGGQLLVEDLQPGLRVTWKITL